MAWRTGPRRPGRHPTDRDSNPTSVLFRRRTFSPRQTRWILLRPLEELDDEERAYRQQLSQESAAIAQAQMLVAAFWQLVRERSTGGQHRQQMGARLEAWLVAAAASQIAELVSFANGILRDFEAVVAALVWDYSQGQTEGQVNRLNSSCSSAVALAVRSSISCASRCCIAAHSAGGGQREAAVFIKYAGVPILLRRL